MKNGWEIKKLGDVCEIYQPKTISISEMVPNGEFPVFGANGIIGKYDQYNHENEELLITCRGATCGSVNISLPKSWINGNAMVVRPKIAGLDRKFLEFLFRGGINISKTITGSAQPQITRQTLAPVQINIPPLLEQQRIVSILDETFAALDQAIENLQRNLQNAKELFQSEKNKIFENLGEIKVKAPIASFCNEIFAGGDAPKENFSDERTDKYPIPIFANAVGKKGLYGFTDISRVNEPSITIAGRGSGTGYTEIRYEPFFPIVRLIVLTPNTEKITLEFLKYAIQNLDISISGSAIPQLTIPMIKGYSLPLLSLSEQQKIVHQLDTLSTQTKKLEKIYQQKLDSIEELRKSILEKAFKGELTEKEIAI